MYNKEAILILITSICEGEFAALLRTQARGGAHSYGDPCDSSLRSVTVTYRELNNAI